MQVGAIAGTWCQELRGLALGSAVRNTMCIRLPHLLGVGKLAPAPTYP